jgi:hypothetical protein
MENVALVGLGVGYIWGAAGILGYPGVSWKPGAVVAVLAALWLVSNGAMSPELVEAGAVIIFLVLMFAREWLAPTKPAEKAKPADKAKGRGAE